MVSANQEMAVYCFDTLIAHYHNQPVPPPAFDEGHLYISYPSFPISFFMFIVCIYVACINVYNKDLIFSLKVWFFL